MSSAMRLIFLLLCVSVFQTHGLSKSSKDKRSVKPISYRSRQKLHSTTRDMVFPSFTEARCMALPRLVCNVQPTTGYETTGTVFFTPEWQPRTEGASSFTCYTRISAVVSNLVPNSEHGFHVHTYGDLSTADGSSTGGHFTNPAGDEIEHGYPNDTVRHWGDFGNLEPDESGIAQYNRVDNVIRLGGVVGRAITIHAENDKGVESQPSGGAGARIGFCVIGYSNPEV